MLKFLSAWDHPDVKSSALNLPELGLNLHLPYLQLELRHYPTLLGVFLWNSTYRMLYPSAFVAHPHMCSPRFGRNVDQFSCCFLKNNTLLQANIYGEAVRKSFSDLFQM